MPATLAKAPAAPRDYAACSGCSLCLLVCPMWRRHHDPRLTPEGLAKALQWGTPVTAAEVAAPVEACSLCGACDPVCPEGIDLSGLIMDLRRQSQRIQKVGAGETATVSKDGPAPVSSAVLLPGPELRTDSVALAHVRALLGTAIADDDGADIALALEKGVEISQDRLQRFLAPLAGRQLVAADGLLLRQLRRWLPGSQRMGLGAALSSRTPIRSKLGPTDLYVIEARAYHADYERMVAYYDRLQRDTGCMLNLDLQRIAIPARAQGVPQQPGMAADDDATQVNWILRGRQPMRVVVESLADRGAFEGATDIPVVYNADLAEN